MTLPGIGLARGKKIQYLQPGNVTLTSRSAATGLAPQAFMEFHQKGLIVEVTGLRDEGEVPAHEVHGAGAMPKTVNNAGAATPPVQQPHDKPNYDDAVREQHSRNDMLGTDDAAHPNARSRQPKRKSMNDAAINTDGIHSRSTTTSTARSRLAPAATTFASKKYDIACPLGFSP